MVQIGYSGKNKKKACKSTQIKRKVITMTWFQPANEGYVIYRTRVRTHSEDFESDDERVKLSSYSHWA